MSSSWGRRNGRRGYDEFRTGLNYKDVYSMLRVGGKHTQAKRSSVLGFWHEIKLQLWAQAEEVRDSEEAGEVPF